MPDSSRTLVAVLTATSDIPVQTGKDYVVTLDGVTCYGHLHSIGCRLQSLLIREPFDELVSPRELASVELIITKPAAANFESGRKVQRVGIADVATGQVYGTGLTIPEENGRQRSTSSVEMQPGFVIWLTGLSGAGKTTIARELYSRLQRSCRVEMLDADILRSYLCKDLGYSREDRNENIRRIGFVAGLLARRGIVVLVSAISPYRAMREEARRSIGRFVEVYVNAPLATCEARDVKGLYKKARAGEISSFTGIDDPYEPPPAPEVECCTSRETVDESVSRVVAFLRKGWINT